MTGQSRTLGGALVVLGVFVFLVFACKEDATPAKHSSPPETERVVQLQLQLAAEQTQRARAEQEAVAAEQSRTTWITGLIAGSIVVCVVIGLLGIHIGSRARRRSRKEAQDG